VKKPPVLSAYEKGHFHYLNLLITLVMLVVFIPYADSSSAGATLSAGLLILIPIAGIAAYRRERRKLIGASILGGIAIATVLYEVAGGNLTDRPFLFMGSIGFYVFMTINIVGDIAVAKRITLDTIYGAICVYLLMGITWAGAYAFIAYLEPSSFSVGATDFDSFLYFSFVTLTTLGYGDLLPVSEAARTAAIMEAMSGVLYSATMIARLVGIHASQHSDYST